MESDRKFANFKPTAYKAANNTNFMILTFIVRKIFLLHQQVRKYLNST